VSSAIIFGGAGFIGSNIGRELVNAGWRVTIVDGLMDRTTGDRENLTRLGVDAELIAQPVEKLENLNALIEGRDLVVDAMGWTRHLDAIRDPAHDLALNVASHLPVIRACSAVKPARVVYLGSRHQYGKTSTHEITEETPVAPVDPQGIHKTAAEQHWIIAAREHFRLASLRFGNTFGPNQPVGEGDAGLIGGFIRDALQGRVIKIFGGERVRNVLFAPDLARAVAQFGRIHPVETGVFNIAGTDVSIGLLAQTIVTAAGSGSFVEEPMPEHIARIDIGEAVFNGSKFEALVGKVSTTPVEDALHLSVEDARNRIAR